VRAGDIIAILREARQVVDAVRAYGDTAQFFTDLRER
jgi:hypothetical protein